MSDDETRYAFRCGADMDPTLVRRATPEARFVARARLTDGRAPLQIAGEGEEAAVWGIVLTLPRTAETSTPAATVETDDKRTFAAVILTRDEDVADPAATIAAARYWELPPDYIQRLGGIEEDTTG